MTDLFAPADRFEPLALDRADVSLLRRFDLGLPDTELLAELVADTPWRAERIVVFGREVAQPRLSCWYGDADAHYAYSGLQLAPLAWTARLADLRRRVEAATGEAYNSVLLNYYRDHRDGMGYHSDDEPELGPAPAIASLSLGERRVFSMKPKGATGPAPVKIPLDSGSLLLMRGPTQRHWLHGLAKLARPCGPRLNLTFRRILRPSARNRAPA
ncbi:alpha-ketoglutarate-dependent dioxygenase AlkB family protein [Lysobacter silvisoli]|uniref:Alpha-ketoglutarate-dependent dioxygenase AlkB n=1 Tax=Lysobacter silvisoli TaxID=2293254 RepID=A0A371K204_9GAMM|nr:alpha-ketoglutarate-dependent dioxygenase AlkB [Lysobacter silvisoli]RDZ27902.1 alpha-ketoglutarate-dependent dioxygenase AlkB [Lysobacter silvisoli]